MEGDGAQLHQNGQSPLPLPPFPFNAAVPTPIHWRACGAVYTVNRFLSSLDARVANISHQLSKLMSAYAMNLMRRS